MDLAQVTNNSSITVPYGTRPAYENSFTAPINNVPTPIGKSYLTLNLGLLKQTNTQVDPSRAPLNFTLAKVTQTGANPTLMLLLQ